MTRTARYAHAGLAWLFVPSVVVQVFLAGLFVFGQEEFRKTHIEFGYTYVGLATLLLLVSALLARPGRSHLGWVLLAFGLYIVQTALPLAKATVPTIAALHPVNALVLFGLGVMVARRAVAIARQDVLARATEVVERVD